MEKMANLTCYILLVTALFSFCSSSTSKTSYARHCNSFVPRSTPSTFSLDSTSCIDMSIGYFTGGHEILDPKPNSTSSPSPSNFLLPGFLYFYNNKMYSTKTSGIFYLTASLNIEGRRTPASGVVRNRRRVAFDNLSGFWSKSNGKLCMVGSGYTSGSEKGATYNISAVLKLDYIANPNISTSVVSGTLESADSSNSSSHFDKLSIFSYAHSKYSYSQIPRARDSCSQANVYEDLLGFDTSAAPTHLIQSLYSMRFRLEHGSGNFQNFMTLNQIVTSEDGKVHMYVGFSNSSGYDYDNFLIPGISLVGEGYWDGEKKQLCLIACPVLKATNSLKDFSFVGECTIGLSIWFPSAITIKNRSNVRGRIWSMKEKSDPGYFSTVSVQSVGTNADTFLPGLKYEYTVLDSVKSSCINNHFNNLGSEKYPDGSSIGDLRFDLFVRDGRGKLMQGYATPLSFDDNIIHGNSFRGLAFENSSVEKNYKFSESLGKVSYTISYDSYESNTDLNEAAEISGEGIYNPVTGTFCMVGCRVPSNSLNFSTDCKISINFQLSPFNVDNGEHRDGDFSRTTHLNGTIRSTREKSEPLFFETLEVSSRNLYESEAIELMRRMAVEITMVLISLTLSCFFILIQLVHVKKHKDVLPSLSIAMLVILTVGPIHPLVSNLHSLLTRESSNQNIVSWSGGWIEANAAVLSVMTTAAFVLHFRLLQLSWASKSSEEGKMGLWGVFKGQAVRFCLMLSFAGALVVWSLHSRPYIGLILDGHLLPQVVLNIIWNSKDKPLAPLFYLGNAAVRAMPHLYNAYRARHYVPYLADSYIYANPNEDFYSTAWDIAIPLEGVLSALLIHLQQRFGGRCFLPRRFRKARWICDSSCCRRLGFHGDCRCMKKVICILVRSVSD